MTVRGIHWATLIACVVLAAGVFVAARRAPTPPTASVLEPVRAIPAGVEGVLTVDVARLRKRGLDGALASRGRRLPELGKLESLCGFDPSDRVTRLAAALDRDRRGAWDIGVAVTGDLPAHRILACADSVTRQREGRPVRSSVGSFATVRDDASKAQGEIGAREGGPVLLGAGTLLRRMVDAADQRIDDATEDPVHHELRKAVGPDGLVVVSWVTRDSQPLFGLPEIRALALRLDEDDDLALFAVIVCESRGFCAGLKRRLEQGDELVSFVRKKTLRVTLEDREMRLRVGLRQRALEALLSRWLETGDADSTLSVLESRAPPLDGRAPRPDGG